MLYVFDMMECFLVRISHKKGNVRRIYKYFDLVMLTMQRPEDFEY